MSLPPEISDYYDRGEEPERLTRGPEGRLEFVRTQVLLGPPPAVERAPSLLGVGRR